MMNTSLQEKLEAPSALKAAMSRKMLNRSFSVTSDRSLRSFAKLSANVAAHATQMGMNTTLTATLPASLPASSAQANRIFVTKLPASCTRPAAWSQKCVLMRTARISSYWMMRPALAVKGGGGPTCCSITWPPCMIIQARMGMACTLAAKRGMKTTHQETLLSVLSFRSSARQNSACSAYAAATLSTTLLSVLSRLGVRINPCSCLVSSRSSAASRASSIISDSDCASSWERKDCAPGRGYAPAGELLDTGAFSLLLSVAAAGESVGPCGPTGLDANKPLSAISICCITRFSALSAAALSMRAGSRAG
mmetsp:Transcript_10097/g.25186  ORF Transcript_10097/g.25186 Transcript_10097/m.25186 type:complete len:308 (-) Transcript_10097:71-994(-)